MQNEVRAAALDELRLGIEIGNHSDVFLSGMKRGRTRSMRIRPRVDVGMWFGLQLQALQAAQGGAHGVELAAAIFVVALDGLQFGREVTQEVEPVGELVPDLQGQVEGFFER